jgi:anti-sigma regulatory factor (Ser/Thr protein kinase)
MAFEARQNVDALLVGEALAREAGPLLTELGCRYEVVSDLATAESRLQTQPISILMAQDPLFPAIIAAAHRNYPRHFIGGSPPNLRDLKITVQKLKSGEIFGIERYDVPVQENTELEGGGSRYPAVGRIKDFFHSAGVAGRIVEKVELALHELVMNAARHRGPENGASRPIALAYGLGADALAVSVGDSFGDLSPERLFAAIRRAAVEKSVVEEPGRGAGLGLFLSLKACGSLVVNVSPGRRTEVIALFHRAKSLGEATKMGHSFHYFQEQP